MYLKKTLDLRLINWFMVSSKLIPDLNLVFNSKHRLLSILMKKEKKNYRTQKKSFCKELLLMILTKLQNYGVDPK